MSNKEKYVKAFTEALEIEECMAEDLQYQAISAWDSVGHMSLISAIEDAFDIMMDTEDIIDFSSFKIGMDILANKYDIKF